MKINFHPEYDNPSFIDAAKEYSDIWKSEGEMIVSMLEQISQLRFIEKSINALVFEGTSYSHPLQLRASNLRQAKKATLVHELSHRICFGNKVGLIDRSEDRKLGAHKVIFLILYDALDALYGEEFAIQNVEDERKYGDAYQKAWDFALCMNKKERANTFASLLVKG